MKKWTKTWKASLKPGKQRNFALNSPLHIKKNLLNAHLSKELKKKYNRNSISVRTGDKIKVMRGNFKGKTGKIERVNHRKQEICVTGIDLTKRDGTKKMIALHPSNLLVTELDLSDKKREKALTRTLTKKTK
jgi:large subunit ribosomal protein L24